MNKFFAFQWNEATGDEIDGWGSSKWFVEVDLDNYPLKQLIVFENANVLKYDLNRPRDEFGMLGDQPVDYSASAKGVVEISKIEFESEWKLRITRNLK